MPLALVLLFGCSGSSSPRTNGIGENSTPILLNFSVAPVLDTDALDSTKPWIIHANQQVQIHALDSISGQQVDNLVHWTVSPWSGVTDAGTLDQTGRYTAPSNLGVVVLSAGSVGPTAYQGAKYIKIVAANP